MADMTKAEMLAEVERATGPATPLNSIRGSLPTARPRRPRGGLESVRASAPGAARSGGTPAPADDSLSTGDRLIIIDQASEMLDAIYAHLPLKRALHAIDPVQRLRLLRLRHEMLEEREFQSEMIDIFVSLRDLHTNYILPTVYHRKYAYLPFRIEEFYAADERKYLVSWVSPKNTDQTLVAGVEVTHWNGMPIELAIARNAAHEAGSNAEARRAQGLEALTLRWFGMSLPPDEDWVVLTYLDASGAVQESRFQWNVIEPDQLALALHGDGAAKATVERRSRLGVDLKTELLRRARKALFDPSGLKRETEMGAYRRQAAAAPTGSAPPAAAAQPAPGVSLLPDVFPRCGTVSTPSGDYGYVRLATFAPEDAQLSSDALIDLAVHEFVRILRTLPPSGLILDVRGNGGGYVNFGERILQTLSPRRITPEPFHFVTTALTLQVTAAESWLTEWEKPLEMALSTGAGFSQGFPLTDPALCDNIGQIYQGPIVLITDALCYSTTDIFAAGFQDHRIGTVLGVHANTGAGGANVWTHDEVLQRLSVKPNPFIPLPAGAGMRVAARRSMRVGERSGVPLEDLGVEPDERHQMTRDDLLKGNVDLIAHAGAILKKEKTQSLQLATSGTAPFSKVQVMASNIDRVDLLVDGRPVASVDVGSSPKTIELPSPVTRKNLVEACGYRGGDLAVRTRITS